MKKILAASTALLLVCGLSGCTDPDDLPNPGGAQPSTGASAADSDKGAAPTPGPSDLPLVLSGGQKVLLETAGNDGAVVPLPEGATGTVVVHLVCSGPQGLEIKAVPGSTVLTAKACLGQGTTAAEVDAATIKRLEIVPEGTGTGWHLAVTKKN